MIVLQKQPSSLQILKILNTLPRHLSFCSQQVPCNSISPAALLLSPSVVLPFLRNEKISPSLAFCFPLFGDWLTPGPLPPGLHWHDLSLSGKDSQTTSHATLRDHRCPGEQTYSSETLLTWDICKHAFGSLDKEEGRMNTLLQSPDSVSIASSTPDL